MKNAAAQMFHTKQIGKQKPDSKTFYRFIGTFEQYISSQQAIINSHIKMKFVNQPHSQDISTLKPKQQVLIFAQVVQQNKLIEGQIRKITIEQALKFQNLMKKLKYKTYEKVNLLGSKSKMTEQEDEKKNKSMIFGQRNGGFYQHF